MKIFIYIALALCAIMFHPLKVCAANESGVAEIQCKECDKTFSNKRDLKNHRRTHTGEKPFECEMCGKLFSDNSNCKRHMQTHTGEKRYKCIICENFFRQTHHLKNHMRIHTGEKPFKCEVCGKCFSDKGNLKVHMRRYHKKNRPQGQFPESSNATNNMPANFLPKTQRAEHSSMSLDGERPYKCKECDKPFTTSGNLTRHMCIHTGENQYNCETCEKCFSCKNNLKVHMRIHTGEKPFKCTICLKCFTQKSNLTNHMRRCNKKNSPQDQFPKSSNATKQTDKCNKTEILEGPVKKFSNDKLNDIINEFSEISCTIRDEINKETQSKNYKALWMEKIYFKTVKLAIKLEKTMHTGALLDKQTLVSMLFDETTTLQNSGSVIRQLQIARNLMLLEILGENSEIVYKYLFSDEPDIFHTTTEDIYEILDSYLQQFKLYLQQQTDTQEKIQQEKIVILIEEIIEQLFLIDPNLKTAHSTKGTFEDAMQQLIVELLSKEVVSRNFNDIN